MAAQHEFTIRIGQGDLVSHTGQMLKSTCVGPTPIDELDDQQLIRLVKQTDISSWQSELNQRRSLLQHRDQVCRSAEANCGKIDRKLYWLSLWLKLPDFPKRIRSTTKLAPCGNVGLMIVVATLSWGLSTLFGLMGELQGWCLFVAGLWGASIGAFLTSVACYVPSEETIAKWETATQEALDYYTEELRTAKVQLRVINRQKREADESCRVAEKTLQRIIKAFRSRMGRLLRADWRALRGIEFEQFLADLFRETGYVVETTKASGDQGVDLVVSRNGYRIAIQAKGWEGKVGNKAVQEAYTGMKLYNCNQCAVITNSDFTRSAVEAAQGTGCILIRGRNLSDLLEGRISIESRMGNQANRKQFAVAA